MCLAVMFGSRKGDLISSLIGAALPNTEGSFEGPKEMMKTLERKQRQEQRCEK